MEIKTKRLTILPVSIGVLAEYETLEYGLKEIAPHILWSLEMTSENIDFEGWGVWLVIENKKIIGDIGFKGKPNADGQVEVGYGILPHEQNKGYATESVTALCEWAFKSGQVKKILADCKRDNVPSVQVLKKLGFKREEEKGELLLWSLTCLNNLKEEGQIEYESN